MVTTYENLLSDDLFSETLEYTKLLMIDKKDKFTSSLLNWDDSLKGNSVPILRYQFDLLDTTLMFKIKNEIEKKINYSFLGGALHLWPNSSYITWHNDYHADAALTIYLNEKWDKNWGGYLMYENGDKIEAIKPQKNLGVLQENRVNHSVTTINVGADLRISLQFFLTKKKKTI